MIRAAAAAAVVAVVMIAGSCSGRRARPPAAEHGPLVVVTPTPSPAAPAPAAAGPTPGESTATYLRTHYAKYEYRIPMRDGVELFTTVYVPDDADAQQRYPFVITRTPYGVSPYGSSRFQPWEPELARDGYILVMQDVRGRYMSGGDFVHVRPVDHHGAGAVDDATDTYDTIDWLVHHVERNNGKAALVGGSYEGFYAAVGGIDGHPALVAIAPEAPVGDWWIGDDIHRNGALCLDETAVFLPKFFPIRPHPSADETYATLDFGTPDAYAYFLGIGGLGDLAPDAIKTDPPFWNDIVAHPDYDAWWQARVLRPRLTNVHAATLVTGGWYDTEDLYGALEVYAGIVEHNPHTPATLIMGPWRHGWWHDPTGTRLGDTDFGVATGGRWGEIEAAFLAHHLKGAPDPDLPAAVVFETGANRWRSFAAWPPPGTIARSYWLDADGVLAAAAPVATGFDEFISDPAHPVPYTQNPETIYWSAEYMAEDQRFASRRPDVLTYQTAPLDRDVTLAGPIEVELAVSTTGTDADWVVKLVDAYPGTMPGWTTADLDAGKPDLGARQLLVRGEPFRGRYRDSLSTPKPFVPGAVATVKFTVDDVFHTFERGHRIMIQVQSSWFPFIDRNPQTFVPSIYAAKSADFVTATHRVHRGSKITVKVLPAADDTATR